MGVGRDSVENALAWHRRWGELANPPEEIAVARRMWQELEQCLTSRQREVPGLRLQ